MDINLYPLSGVGWGGHKPIPTKRGRWGGGGGKGGIGGRGRKGLASMGYILHPLCPSEG